MMPFIDTMPAPKVGDTLVLKASSLNLFAIPLIEEEDFNKPNFEDVSKIYKDDILLFLDMTPCKIGGRTREMNYKVMVNDQIGWITVPYVNNHNWSSFFKKLEG